MVRKFLQLIDHVKFLNHSSIFFTSLITNIKFRKTVFQILRIKIKKFQFHQKNILEDNFFIFCQSMKYENKNND